MPKMTIADIPSNKIFSFSREMHVVREKEVVSPINDLPIDIVGILGTEWWVSYLSALLQSWKKGRTD
jgi:hypothetical protein